MEKSIIIIGGGIADLSAGCYLRMNGYHTSIFEMHNKTGGVCTGWKRKDYTIDGAMHWLVGTKPGKIFYNIWKELGVIQGRTIVDHEQYMLVEGVGGKVLIIYSDIGRLEQHMKELAPEDKEVIEEFANTVRACTKIDTPVEKASELSKIHHLMAQAKDFWVWSSPNYARSVSPMVAKQRAVVLHDPLSSSKSGTGACRCLKWDKYPPANPRTAGYCLNLRQPCSQEVSQRTGSDTPVTGEAATRDGC